MQVEAPQRLDGPASMRRHRSRQPSTNTTLVKKSSPPGLRIRSISPRRPFKSSSTCTACRQITTCRSPKLQRHDLVHRLRGARAASESQSASGNLRSPTAMDTCAFVEDDQVIEALATDGPNQPLLGRAESVPRASIRVAGYRRGGRPSRRPIILSITHAPDQTVARPRRLHWLTSISPLSALF
jgi:hypothetical protein